MSPRQPAGAVAIDVDEPNATLRQMLAVLEAERQALGELDLEGILGCAGDKQALCGRLEATPPAAIDAEARGLLEAARHLNEVNRQVRNIIAANVAARLEALTGTPPVYQPRSTPAYGYAGGRR